MNNFDPKTLLESEGLKPHTPALILLLGILAFKRQYSKAGVILGQKTGGLVPRQKYK